MVFVNHEGTVGGRKSFGRLISDFFMGIYSFFALFFTSIMNPPAVQASSRTANYAQRNSGRSFRGGNSGNRLGRGSNIRGVGNLQGPSEAKMGGG